MIDGTKSLHEILESVQQLSNMQAHSIALQKYLNVMMERTYAKSPTGRVDPSQSYELGRGEKPDPTGERLIEKMIWKQWNYRSACEGPLFLNDICKSILTYQMPLQGTRDDRKWGRIDLVGITNRLLPVVIELKIDRGEARTNDTPLRMLVEGVAYAVAVRRAWNEGPLLKEWREAVRHGNELQCDAVLTEIPVILLAPVRYWTRAVGEPGLHTNGKVPEAAWPSFIQLAHKFGDHGFPVHFVSFEIIESSGVAKTSNMSLVRLPTR